MTRPEQDVIIEPPLKLEKCEWCPRQCHRLTFVDVSDSYMGLDAVWVCDKCADELKK